MFKIISTCKGGHYRYCRTKPKHPNANKMGLYPLHRVIMENKLGRLLTRGELVHHKNGDPTDDREKNLELTNGKDHSRHHLIVEKIKCECGFCGKSFKLSPSFCRARLKRSKHKKLFCSLSCGAKYQHKTL